MRATGAAQGQVESQGAAVVRIQSDEEKGTSLIIADCCAGDRGRAGSSRVPGARPWSGSSLDRPNGRSRCTQVRSVSSCSSFSPPLTHSSQFLERCKGHAANGNARAGSVRIHRPRRLPARDATTPSRAVQETFPV